MNCVQENYMLSTSVRSFRKISLSFFFVVAFAASAFSAPVNQDVKVAVLPFEIYAGDDLAYLKESLPELLSDKLSESGFDVVAQNDVITLLREKNTITLTDKNSRETALLLGAGFSIYGTFNQIGETLTIDARIVDAFGEDEPKKVVVTKEGLINLLPAVDELVLKMRSGLLRQDVIAEVDVSGAKVLDKEVVLMRLPLAKGDLMTAKSINEALKSIYDLGYFDDVKVKVTDVSGGKRVAFEIIEKPRIQAISILGSDAIDSEDIIEAIATKKGGVINPKVLGEDIKLVREMYRKEGYYKAKVTHEVETGDGSQARLNFKIDEGEKLYIEEVLIDGAQQLDPDDIKDELALKERGFLSFINNSGVLKEEYLERDAAAIMAYYHNNGFIEAKVGRAEVEVKDDGISVIFRVHEGERYRMGKVIFKGDLLDEPEKLAEITKVDELSEDEEYFNRSTAQDDVKELTSHYNNYGYAYADIAMKLNDDPEAKVVDVEYTISKHQKVHIRRVLVEGNNVTRDNVILRDMRLADGDVFSGKKMNISSRRLDGLELFEKVNISPVQTGNPDEMDLLVQVKEKPTGRFGGGIGYSTFDGPYIGANITERNLFGKGYNSSLAALVGEEKTRFDLNFINPMVNDSNLGLGFNIFHKIQDEDDWNRDGTGGSITTFYPLGDRTRLKASYNIESYRIYDTNNSTSKDIKDDEGSHLNSSLAVSLIRDTRDSYRYPTSGYKWTGSLSYGGGILGGTDDYVRYVTTADYFHKFIGRSVFHVKGYLGLVHENFGGGEIPSGQRFKLGGQGSVRGYSQNQIEAQDNATESIGGDKAFYSNIELIIPVSDEWGVQLVPFFDMGNVWKEDEFWFESVERFNNDGPSLGLYKSTGAEVRWNSPIGPLSVSYGYGFDELHDSKQQVVDFSVGQQF